MITRSAQLTLTATALVVGIVQPAVNGLTMLCLGMLAVAGYLELRLQAPVEEDTGAAESEAA